MPTFFTITVDTEEEWNWSQGWPTRDLSVRNIQELPGFHERCLRNGASVTYFTNHAVLADPAGRKTILDLANKPGAEIGMHIHPWNTPPDIKEKVTARETFLHNLPAELIHAKLSAVYNLFAEHGLKPTSFRGGRYSSGGPIHEFLFERDFRVDYSIVPYTNWADDGAPDYRDRNLWPRRLPAGQADQPALWELPLSLAFSRQPFGFWHRASEAIVNSPLRHLRLIGAFAKVGLVRRIWLNFEDPMGSDMLPLLVRLRRLKVPCICFTLHSSSLLAGGNHYTPDGAARERLLARVDATMALLRTWEDFQPATATEVANHLERNYASSRN